MQILTANHWLEVGDPYGGVEGKTKGTERDCNHIVRTTVSTDLDPSKLPETRGKQRSIH